MADRWTGKRWRRVPWHLLTSPGRWPLVHRRCHRFAAAVNTCHRNKVYITLGWPPGNRIDGRLSAETFWLCGFAHLDLMAGALPF